MAETPKKKPGKTLSLNSDQQETLYDLLERGIKQQTIADQSEQLFGIKLTRTTIRDYKKRIQQNVFDETFNSQGITTSIVYRNTKLCSKYYDEALNGDKEATGILIKLQEQLIKLGGLQADIKVIHTIEYTPEQRQQVIDFISNPIPLLELEEADEN